VPETAQNLRQRANREQLDVKQYRQAECAFHACTEGNLRARSAE